MSFRRFSALPRLVCAAFAVLAATPPSIRAADRSAQREQFRTAYAAAPRSPEAVWKKLAYGLDADRYPLYPYIEFAALRPRLGKASAAEVEGFLTRWKDTLPAADLRKAWLRELARRGDWPAFTRLYEPFPDRDLQCSALRARLVRNQKLDFARDLEALWSSPQPLPDSCGPVMVVARAERVLDDAMLWARIDRAARSGNAGIISATAALFDGGARADAERIAAAVRDPAVALAKAGAWADEPRTRDALSYALARRARRDTDAAIAIWSAIQDRFRWDAPQKNRILHALALFRASSYAPDAAQWLAQLPAEADDDATREWRVRIAIAGADDAATLAALDRLTDTQKADSRWKYLRARVLSRQNRDAESNALFAELAREATFHGFLAADWLDQPYSICPTGLAVDARKEEALARQPDLARAFEFRELGLLPEARREWDFALGKLDPEQRRLAADLASRRGWIDRAVFLFSASPDTQSLYEQRFPLTMERSVRAHSERAGIDPAWAYAIIRAESAWMSDARSHANAYGLMQLLPAVGKAVAKAEGVTYSDATDLFEPELNVRLGTRYLAQMAARFDGSPWLASAAYNAGAGAVGRWLDARGTLDPDLFIETIPYKETREYVARVMAFTLIHDWRMNGKVVPLSAHLPRIGKPYRPPGAGDARKTIECRSAARTPARPDSREPEDEDAEPEDATTGP